MEKNIKSIISLRRYKEGDEEVSFAGTFLHMVYAVNINKKLFNSLKTSNFQRFDVLYHYMMVMHGQNWKLTKKIVVLLPRKSETDILLYLVLTKNNDMYVCNEKPKFNTIFPHKVENAVLHLGNGIRVIREAKEFTEILERLLLLDPKEVFDTSDEN
jgi:hypothetical protein